MQGSPSGLTGSVAELPSLGKHGRRPGARAQNDAAFQVRGRMITSITRRVRAPLQTFRLQVSMLGALAKKIFGSANDRRVKAYRPRVAAINALEPELEALSDAD